MESRIDPQIVVDFLNEIHAIDPTVLPLLINNRVYCNEQLANHPTIQCERKQRECVTDDYEYRVGFMGIINGLVGVRGYGNGYIAYTHDGENITGFRLTEETVDKEFDLMLEKKKEITETIMGYPVVWSKDAPKPPQGPITLGTFEDWKEMASGDVIRKLIYCFVELPHVYRVQIMQDLELDIDGWQEMSNEHINNEIVKKVLEQKKTDEFVDAVNRMHKETEK